MSSKVIGVLIAETTNGVAAKVTDGVAAEVTDGVAAEVTDGVTAEVLAEVSMAHLGASDGTEHFDGDFSALSFLLYLHLDATESFAALFSTFSIRWFSAIENNHNYNCTIYSKYDIDGIILLK